MGAVVSLTSCHSLHGVLIEVVGLLALLKPICFDDDLDPGVERQGT